MKVRACTYCGKTQVFDSWPAGGIACCEAVECCQAYDTDYKGGARLDLTDCGYSVYCRNVAVVIVDMRPVGEVKCCRQHADFYERMGV